MKNSFRKIFSRLSFFRRFARRNPKRTALAILLIVAGSCFFLASQTKGATIAWDGGAGPTDYNWNSCDNWSGNACPGTSDIALFDATSSKNALMNVDVNVAGISITADYGGTITQASTKTVTVGTSHFSQAGGTFSGGDSAININGDFTLSGGSFTSTSGTMSLARSFTQTGSPNFTHNGGTVAFTGTYQGDTSIDAPDVDFNLVTINRTIGWVHSYTLTIASGTTIPLGDNPTVTLKNTSGENSYHLTNNGNINIGGTGFTFDSQYCSTFSNSGTITASTVSTFSFLGSGFSAGASSTTTTASNPTFNVAGSFIVASGATFPDNSSLNLDGSLKVNSSIDAPDVDFNLVTINRTIGWVYSYTLTIASGTTIPLGDNPTVTLKNTSGSLCYHLTNNGNINIGGTGFTFDSLHGSTFTNSGTITASTGSTFSFLGSGFSAGASSTNTTASNPTFNVAGSFIVASGATFPDNSTLNLNGGLNVSSSIDAPDVDFELVSINRTSTDCCSTATLTIANGTTIPLGDNPTATLKGYASSNLYHLTNNGNLNIGGTGFTFDSNNNSIFTNNGTITASTSSTFSFLGSGFSAGSSSTTTTASNPTFNVAGSFIVASGATFPDNSTLNLNGGLDINSSIDAPGIAFNLVTISRTIPDCCHTRSLTIASGTTVPFGDNPTVTLTSSSTTAYNLVNDGNINIGGTGFTFDSLNNSTFTNNGTITASNVSDFTFANSGFTANHDSVLTSADSPSFNVAGSFTVVAGATFPANLTLNLDGALAFNTSVDAPDVSFDLVTISRTRSGAPYDTYTLTIANGTTIPLGDNPTITLKNSSDDAYRLTNNGNINIGGTGFTFDSLNSSTFTNSGTITASTGSTFNFTGSSFTSSHNSVLNSAASPTFNVSGSFIVASEADFPANPTLNLDGTVGFNTSVDAPDVNFGLVTISRTRSIGTPYNACTLTIANGTTIPLGDNPTIILKNNSSYAYHLANYGNINVGGTGFTFDGLNNSTFTNNGTITASTGSTFTFTNSNFTANHDSVFTTAATPTFNVSANFTVSSGATFPNPVSLTLSGSSGTQTFNAPGLSFGTFAKTAGSSVTIPRDFTTQNLTFSGGTISNPSSAYEIAVTGDLTHSSTGALGGANLTLRMRGSGTQILTYTGSGAFSSPLEIAPEGEVKLGANFTYTTAALTVERGTFNLDGKNLSVSSGITVAGGATFKLWGSETTTLPTLADGSTVLYTGEPGQANEYLINNWNYKNLSFDGGSNQFSNADYDGPEENLSARWKFDDGEGTAASDSSGNSNIGTLQSMDPLTDWIAGRINGGLDFDGSDDYVYTTTSFASPQNFTVSAWFKTSSASGKKIVGLESSRTGISSGSYDRHIYMDTDGKIRFGCVSIGANYIISTNSYNDGEWHMATATHNGSSNAAELYVDGNYQGTFTSACQNFTGYWRIGSYKLSGWTNGSDGYFPGQIDDVRVYSVPLSGSEIAALFASADGSTFNTLAVAGNLNIISGTLKAPAMINVAGDWSNTGSFEHNSGTVNFTGGGSATQTISGNTTFWNFSASASQSLGRTLRFTDGTAQTVSGTWTIAGAAGKMIKLTGTGVAGWSIAPQNASVTYAVVDHSTNTVGTVCATYTGDEGSNSGWDFGTADSCGTTGLDNVRKAEFKGDFQIRGNATIK